MPKKKLKASILVITMIILGIILLSSLSVSLVSLNERKASISNSKSNQAFQNAQSGVELVMQEIESGKILVSELSNCDDADTKLIIGEDASYTVELRDMDSKIDCDSSRPITDIAYLVSIGSFKDTQRSIQAAIALP
ncbi:MAG: hypothetical protein WA064_03265 [Candidatus Moraniibacteriota bacterium]